MKKVTKKTNSTKTPSLVVDLTDEFNIKHPRFAFIEAKLNQHISFTQNDFDAICSLMRDYVIKAMFGEHNAVVNIDGQLYQYDAILADVVKKQPWYKRLWNWITRKK